MMLRNPSVRLVAMCAIFVLMLTLIMMVPAVHAEGGEEDQFQVSEKKDLKYPNLGSQLSDLVARVEDGEAPAGEAAEEASIHRGESVAVTIHLSGNVDEVVSFLEDNGGDPRNVGEDYIEAYVPVSLLGAVSQRPGVIRVREIVSPQPEYGNITSQGVQAHLVQPWHDAGYRGQGVKVGIIDSFEGIRSLMGTELPTTVVARCYTDIAQYSSNLSACDSGSSHGTGVVEAVIDVAPGVALYIANPRSPADLQSAADWMISQGVSVINRSASYPWFDGPGDGTSRFILSELNTISRAVGGGAVWVNSAGNYATETWFRNSPVIHTVTTSTFSIDFVAFDGIDDIGNGMRGLGEGIVLILRWDDRWDGASSDLDLLLWDTVLSQYVARSEDYQTGQAGHDPLELVTHELVEGRLYEIVVVHRSGRVPDWVQVVARGPVNIEHFTENGSINNPSESANRGMLAVGATHYWDTHTIADYSSRGPTPDGRVKPDIVGTACGETASYEPRPPEFYDGNSCWFPGTSQAAPHVAGLAALVRQRFPDYTAEQTAAYLKDHAEERGVPSADNIWGSGFAQLPSPDRAALVALYNATGGANWTNNANWLTYAPIGQWHGVTTGANGRVTKLELQENGLSGEVPVELARLANLQELHLPRNQLTGSIPAELGSLASLEKLWLFDNQLTGEIPSELSNLTNLTALSVSANQLTGEIPPELGNLAELTVLYLSGNELTGEIPSELSNLTNLTALSVSANQLTGEIPRELGNLAELTVLYLSGNELTGEIPSELGSLTNLTELSVPENQLTGEIPSELSNLASLEKLWLFGNQLSGEIPPELGNLANLQELDLTRNQLTGPIPAELGRLVNLSILALGGNGLTGEIPNELGTLSSLRQLYLWDNELTGTIPSRLGSLSQLTWLSLLNNELSGEMPPELGNLSGLENLRLWGNHLSGEIPSELGNLANLIELSLGENQFTGEIPSTLSNLANLEELLLRGNQLSGEIPAELGNLANLERVTLDDNQLSGQMPSELGSLTNLTELSVSENQLTGEIPADLGSLASLEKLWLYDNRLSGEIPSELGNLMNLEGLSLWGNQLSGKIPSELGNLANLTELSLGRNQLTGEIPADLGGLASLEKLWLYGNQLSGEIPSELSNLANLQELDLTRNQLTGPIPAELGGLVNLSILVLGGNELTGGIPGPLGGLTNLTELFLWGNQLSGEIPPELGNLANLEILELGDNELTGEIPADLDSLADLEKLWLYDNQLSGEIPAELGSLANLAGLSLWGNQLSGQIPSELSNLSNLMELSLSENQLTGEIPADLGDLAKLEKLWLYDNQLSGGIPLELGNLASLERLNLRSNQLTGVLPNSLTGMTALTQFYFYNNPGLCAPVDNAFQEWLESIADAIGSSCAPTDSPEDRAVLVELYQAAGGAGWWNSATWLSDRPVREWHGVTTDANGRVIHLVLGGNQLTGEIPAELGSLTMLERLWLHDNQLSGEIPAELGNLSNLERLYLFDNQLTGTIPAELGGLTNLAHLRLDVNQLTGDIPAELGHLANLTLLYLSGNQLTGCVPDSLRDVADNDFVQLGLTFCTSEGSPGVTVSHAGMDPAAPVRIGTAIPVAAAFTKTVTGFTVDDVAVGNGIVGNFLGSGTAYSFDVTPKAIGQVTVDIAANVAEDTDGNGNTAAAQLQLGIPYDDNRNGVIERGEVIKAVNDYLQDGSLERAHVIALINLYLSPPAAS